jgi:hypothetical protein
MDLIFMGFIVTLEDLLLKNLSNTPIRFRLQDGLPPECISSQINSVYTPVPSACKVPNRVICHLCLALQNYPLSSGFFTNDL